MKNIVKVNEDTVILYYKGNEILIDKEDLPKVIIELKEV